jgi:uncharacterized protein
MPFNLFHKKKQEEQQAPAVPPPETRPVTELQAQSPQLPPESAPVEEPVPASFEETPPAGAMAPAVEQPQPEPQPTVEAQPAPEPVSEQKTEAAPEIPSKTYLKAMPLKDLADLENIKNEVHNGNIIILKITPLAQKSIEDVKSAVNDLFQFTDSMGGDIARLGEERVVICPKTVRIWREKTPKPVANEPLPTAAA